MDLDRTDTVQNRHANAKLPRIIKIEFFSGLCIIRHESNYDTGNEYVENGKTYRGLFGISEDHCKPHKRANQSGLPCTNLCTSKSHLYTE